jgi:hypothetical protein
MLQADAAAALKNLVKNERSSAAPRWAKCGPMGSR